MAAQSDSAKTVRWWRRTLPRLVLEVWLWLAVLSAGLESSGCPIKSAQSFCQAFSNTVGMAFELFPASLLLIYAKVFGGFPAAVAAIAVTALACHLALRRLAPDRLRLTTILLIYLIWFALSFIVQIWAFYVAFDVPGPLAPFLARVIWPGPLSR